jgi:hypothetical protein
VTLNLSPSFFVAPFHLSAPEGDGGVVLDVEEVGRLEMGVAVGGAGVDARSGDLDVHGRVLRILLVDFNGSLHVLEAAANGGEHHVLDRELDGRVSRIDLPGRFFCHGGSPWGSRDANGRPTLNIPHNE